MEGLPPPPLPPQPVMLQELILLLLPPPMNLLSALTEILMEDLLPPPPELAGLLSSTQLLPHLLLLPLGSLHPRSASLILPPMMLPMHRLLLLPPQTRTRCPLRPALLVPTPPMLIPRSLLPPVGATVDSRGPESSRTVDGFLKDPRKRVEQFEGQKYAHPRERDLLRVGGNMWLF